MGIAAESFREVTTIAFIGALSATSLKTALVLPCLCALTTDVMSYTVRLAHRRTGSANIEYARAYPVGMHLP